VEEHLVVFVENERNKGMRICEIISGVLLLILAVWDIKKMEVPVILIVVTAIIKMIGVAFAYRGHEIGISTLIISLIPASILILTRFCAKSSIGTADGPILAVALLGMKLTYLYVAVSVMAVVSYVMVVIMLIRYKGKNTRIPYVPAIAVGSVVSTTLGFCK